MLIKYSDESLLHEIKFRMDRVKPFAAFERLLELDRDAYEAVEQIAREIVRQRDPEFGEGWTVEHDDQHDKGEMAAAASCYAANACLKIAGENTYPAGEPPAAWMWGAEWWKPKNVNRDLIRAGALIAVEWGRFFRAAARKYSTHSDLPSQEQRD